MKFILSTVLTASLLGCASIPDNYQLGDGTAHYCATTSPEVREAGRILAARAGITLVDLCSAAGLLVGTEAPDDD